MPDDTVDQPADPADDELEDEETQPSGRKGPRRPGPLDRAVANHTAYLRERRGWSLQDLADRVTPDDPNERWTKSRVTQFEKPTRRATITELSDLCDAFDVTLATFLQDAGVIALPQSTRGWIEADPTLNLDARTRVLDIYLLSRTQNGA
jgi:transcriptional regulator with XRE-family HTH domain